MHDAVQRNAGRQIRYQRSPRPAIFRVQRLRHDAWSFRRLCVSAGTRTCREHHRLVPCGKVRCQLRRNPGTVGRDDPYALRFSHLCRALSHNHAPVGRAGGFGRVHAQDFHRLEARIAERLPPHLRTGQRMVRAVVIGESPPAIQLSERQIQPALASQVLQGHQLTGRRQQIAAVGQGFVEVTGGVQHVRGDQQIVAVGFEALLQRILLDIQNPVVEEKAVCRETRLGFGKEARGNIRIDVVVPAGRQFG